MPVGERQRNSEAQSETKKTGWEDLGSVEFPEHELMQPARVEQAVKKEAGNRAMLVDQLTEEQKNRGSKVEASDKEKSLRETIDFIDRNSPEAQTKQRLEAAEAKQKSLEEHERNQAEIEAMEHLTATREHKEAIKRYGEDIGEKAARDAFFGDKAAIEMRKSFVKKMEEIEQQMSPADRAKAEKRRKRDGKVWTATHEATLREVMHAATGKASQEHYGRKKAQYYKEISDMRKQHPLKYLKAVRRTGVKLEKKWNNVGTSLHEYRQLHESLSAMLNKE